MNRRSFLQTAGSAGLATGLAPTAAQVYIPEHNWEKYDWGCGPGVKDRLYQGPFPQYPPAAVDPDSDVVMVTTPSLEIVPNYGMDWLSMSPVTRARRVFPARRWRSHWKIW